MDEEGSPRMAFGASQKKDETKAYLRMLHARDSDEDVLDVVGDTSSSQPSTPRGVFSREFPEAPQDRQSGSQQFRKVVVNWTDSSRMALIEEVSKRRNLWDITSAAYKDKQQSGEDWHRVRAELNATLDSCYEVEEVKKQWKNLRDSFQKRMKAAKEPKTGSAAGDPPTKWIFFEAMQFLLEFNDEEYVVAPTSLLSSEIVTTRLELLKLIFQP
ncbi:unnamed protein product [Heligmosomoides polygyrus]|uniref:MADF domain-containing protein n=1 Tax=Heligmosomoides polygyrus TaxID=6339 RepID=A0A183FNH8_HELPZ|nr:unnamed protein product [Heligmosomoides polygyrus]